MSNVLTTAIAALQDTPDQKPAWQAENEGRPWGVSGSGLATVSSIQGFTVGSGADIFNETLCPALEQAEQEVILVTCFWAASDSLSSLSSSLLRLSSRVVAHGHGRRIRVFLGFSSRSLLQKLFHTSSLDGKLYDVSTASKSLGLPTAESLPGLEVCVKSIFLRPVSIMHPKFLIVDRQRLWMPSCNVSWERWVECSIALQGPVVGQILQFWQHFWRPPSSFPSVETLTSVDSEPKNVILLPSPAHAAWNTSLPLWFLFRQLYPLTPLNVTLMYLFDHAQESVRMITPNLTAPPVVDALVRALARGVDVHITTNRRMMVVEQLVTTLTVTEFWVWRLVRRYKSLCSQNASARQLEAGSHSIGRLRVEYIKPSLDSSGFVKSHVKCTAVDKQVVVLGSGNMDRASWFTSQELGVAIQHAKQVQGVMAALDDGLSGRVETYFAS